MNMLSVTMTNLKLIVPPLNPETKCWPKPVFWSWFVSLKVPTFISGDILVYIIYLWPNLYCTQSEVRMHTKSLQVDVWHPKGIAFWSKAIAKINWIGGFFTNSVQRSKICLICIHFGTICVIPRKITNILLIFKKFNNWTFLMCCDAINSFYTIYLRKIQTYKLS